MASTQTPPATVTKGLLVRLQCRPGKEQELEGFVADARTLVAQEPGTTAWFAVRFGRSRYGIFDVFPDEQARETHIGGAVADALKQRGAELFAERPRVERLDVLADKLPPRPPHAAIRKGLLLSFSPKSGNEQGVADFLRGARELVALEPGTLAWFAIALEDGRYGIFDVFAGNRSRIAHISGRVPRALARHAPSLLGSIPRLSLPGVLAAELGD